MAAFGLEADVKQLLQQRIKVHKLLLQYWHFREGIRKAAAQKHKVKKENFSFYYIFKCFHGF